MSVLDVTTLIYRYTPVLTEGRKDSHKYFNPSLPEMMLRYKSLSKTHSSKLPKFTQRRRGLKSNSDFENKKEMGYERFDPIPSTAIKRLKMSTYCV